MRRLLGVVLAAGIIGVTGLTAVGGSEDQSGPGVISPTTSKIEWVGTKTGGKHDGGFKDFSGKLDPATGDLTASTIKVEINAGSLYSDVGKLTQHLKSPDFFGVDTYPKASFVSSKIESAVDGSNTHKITGELTLHGVKKEITFPAKIVETGDKVKLNSTFKINREDFGMTGFKGKVDSDVTIKLAVEVSRK
ncbi:MAG TPA: YceI family protein [Gemmataceae bacterium]|jgi:polyisoprenoid-binding protein YceI|nr:YceI family protein [Gemmataceae bacterium]